MKHFSYIRFEENNNFFRDPPNINQTPITDGTIFLGSAIDLPDAKFSPVEMTEAEVLTKANELSPAHTDDLGSKYSPWRIEGGKLVRDIT